MKTITISDDMHRKIVGYLMGYQSQLDKSGPRMAESCESLRAFRKEVEAALGPEPDFYQK